MPLRMPRRAGNTPAPLQRRTSSFPPLILESFLGDVNVPEPLLDCSLSRGPEDPLDEAARENQRGDAERHRGNREHHAPPIAYYAPNCESATLLQPPCIGNRVGPIGDCGHGNGRLTCMGGIGYRNVASLRAYRRDSNTI